MMETRKLVETINNEVTLCKAAYTPAISTDKNPYCFQEAINALKEALYANPTPTSLKLDFSVIRINLLTLPESERNKKPEHYLMIFQTELMKFVCQQLQEKRCSLEALHIEGWLVKDKIATGEKTEMLNRLGSALRTNKKLRTLTLNSNFTKNDLDTFLNALRKDNPNLNELALCKIFINEFAGTQKTVVSDKSPKLSTKAEAEKPSATVPATTEPNVSEPTSDTEAKQALGQTKTERATRVTTRDRQGMQIQIVTLKPIVKSKTTAIPHGVDTDDNPGADVPHFVRANKTHSRDLFFFAFSALLGLTGGTLIGGLVTFATAGIGAIAQLFVGNAALLTVLGVGLTASGIGAAVGLAILGILAIAGTGYCLYQAEKLHQADVKNSMILPSTPSTPSGSSMMVIDETLGSAPKPTVTPSNANAPTSVRVSANKKFSKPIVIIESDDEETVPLLHIEQRPGQ